MQGWGVVHHAGVWWVGSCRGGRNRETKGKERHSDGPHEFQGCYSQKYSRGGVGWVMQGWGGVGHIGVGLGGSYRGGMGWVMKNIKILKILNYWCYRVSNPANQNQICRVLNFLNHDK